jgi:hypothetical protein
MVGNDSGADPFGWLIRYVPTGQCLRRTESSAWTGPGPTLSAIVGMYDGLACAPRAQRGDRGWLESTVIALGMTTIRLWFSRSPRSSQRDLVGVRRDSLPHAGRGPRFLG